MSDYSDREECRKRIGSRLRAAREQAGLSQTDVQKTLHYKSTGTVSQHEAGIRMPPPAELFAMSQLYDVSADWLFGKEPPHKIQASLIEDLGQLSLVQQQAVHALVKSIIQTK